ncbi:MAG: L-ribulose-5-phosphate 3-epimerase, partial [Acholeplasmatales bacterium]|nr:L-ribulose-5-phosphate 3-epimerase [Acholeplasmatales bacterium]
MSNSKYQLGIYEKAIPNSFTIKEKLVIAKNHGFDFLELSLDETREKLERLDFDTLTISDLNSYMESINFHIESFCLSALRKYPYGSRDASIREKSLEITEKAIILAKKLGIKYIQIAGYDVYYEESSEITEKLFFDTLEKAVKIAEKYEVILAFETMETSFMDTVSKANKVVQIINSKFLKIYPDLGNITNANLLYKTSVIDDLRVGENNIVAIHLKESREGIYRNLIVGEGHVDFRSLLIEAKALGVSRFVCEFWALDDVNYLKNIIIDLSNNVNIIISISQK